MKRMSWKKVFARPVTGTLVAFVLACVLIATGPDTKIATADHSTPGQSFTFLQAGFTQELFGVVALGNPPILGGVAFAPDGDPLVSECFLSGGPIHRFDHQGVATPVNGTNLHPQTIINNTSGCGITNHPDGNLYTNTGSGILRLNANTGAILGGPFGQSGNALGIAPDPQTGNLVYVAGDGSIRFVDSGFTTSGVFSSATGGGDGIAFDPTGNFLFISEGFNLVIVNRAGAIVRSVPVSAATDGIAFHAATPKFVVTNNINGTMTRFDFPGDDFTQVPTQSLFASGGFRGDLAQVGPDGCLYLTQNGTRYNDGTVTSENSVVRICGGFAPPPGVGDCTITCPPDVTKDADANQCSAVVTYPDPAVSGGCTGGGPGPAAQSAAASLATCVPPSGSRFPVGETTVICTVFDSEEVEHSCSFIVTVLDKTPPAFACPQQPVPASCTGPLTYTTPSVTDNCTVTSVTCTPPSGSPFPSGSTVVTCVARDGSGNESSCSFQVVAQDKTPPDINCPANPAPVTASGSCTASVTFARATATDGCGGEVTVRGVRLDTNQEVGTSGVFPVGDTFIRWTATDKAGNQSVCTTQQKVTVIGQSNMVVPAEVDFGKIDFQIANKKKAKKRVVSLADSSRSFTIKNDGCSSSTLTLKAINRTGEDVTNGKIANPDDSDFFQIEEVGGGFKSPKNNNLIQFSFKEEKRFNITFQPELPVSSGGKNSGLSTKQALPDPFTAEIVLMDAAGTTFKIALKADLSNDVHFINPNDIQKKAPFVSFTRSGDVFTVEYTLYDADTGGKQANSASFVKSAKYEFLDNTGNVVGTVDAELAGPIEAANLAKGQRFKVTKTFSGADDNSSVSRVRVTVTDGVASPSLEANLGSAGAAQSSVSAQGFTYGKDVTIYLSGDRPDWFKR